MAGPLLSAPASAPEEDVEEFIGNVDEVHRLIEGLKAGTISPEYIDSKTKHKQEKEEEKKKRSAKESEGRGPTPAAPSATQAAAPAKDEGDDDAEEERKERAMAKVKELIANRERKLRARAMYEEYEQTKDKSRFGTDYTKWDIWCPDDEEDELINSIAPNEQFRAMEKDIDERHRQLVERRQLAERARVAGNAAYGARQYTEALRCYQQGLESERTNMALHANAAMAALKINCFVQAIEHADKVLSIADFFHNNKNDPLCVKALQRRAEAYRALQQTGRAVEDLQAALDMDPKNAEVAKQLARARLEDDEARKQRAVARAVAKGAGGEAGSGSGSGTVEAAGLALDLGKLGRVEKLAAALAPPAPPAPAAAAAEGEPASASTNGTSNGVAPAAGAGEAAARRGPTLPPRPAGKGVTAAGAAAGAGATAAASTSGSGSGSVAAGGGSVAATCEELRGLLKGDDGCCVYLRECGGLQSLATRIIKAAPSAASPAAGAGSAADLAALLAALNDGCMNDGNLKQLPALKVLPAAVACLDGAGEEAAAAAAALLCTAVTNEDVRKEVSAVLGGAPSNGKKDGVDGLGRLLRVLTGAKPAVQGVALALLGNCMVDRPTKAAMTAAWRAEPTTSTAATSSTAPAPSSPAPASTASSAPASTSSSSASASAAFLSLLRSPVGVLAEKAAVLLGNMATDPSLRAEMLARHGAELVGQLVALTAPPPPPAKKQKAAAAGAGAAVNVDADARRAAATALFNLTMDEAGQKLVAEDGEGLGRLYGLVAATAADRTLAARAAGVVARAARTAPGAAALLKLGAVAGMMGTAVAALEAVEASSSSSSSNGSDAAERESTLAILDAAVRTVTLLTTPDDAALSDPLVAAGGVAALLRIIRAASAGGGLAAAAAASGDGSSRSSSGTVESVLGNAVLCLAGVARRAELLPALRGADPVPPLIKVAYDGKGNAASKNAAICLARLARDTPMLERLRELHGIEIIYQYVQPR
ncbi:hypothetical protein HXX76_002785 [Chlamydomonas incerta]|uniref:Protein unc-45 homolog B n=1 Tax=Chlamydomonas incerta TaxID=51695 RepID=A0A835TC19_CHLIN|nr:hypothetical protein HXX76_002785 [Chlamydomonas incerta]|eukprot:KAG2442702.1 hypothetical protein HXX76_002785 [Chlamydomonas incerta]